jgi:hypothetical protein
MVIRRLLAVSCLLFALANCGDDEVVFPDVQGGTGTDAGTTPTEDGGTTPGEDGGTTPGEDGGTTPGEDATEADADEGEDVRTAVGGWTFSEEAWEAFRPRQGQAATVSVILDRDETAALPGTVTENVPVFGGVYTQVTYGTPAPGGDAFRVTVDLERPWRIGLKAIEVWYNFQTEETANSWLFDEPIYIPLDSLIGSRQRVNGAGTFRTSGFDLDYTVRMDWIVQQRELSLETPLGAFREAVTELTAEVRSSDKPGGDYPIALYFHPELGLLDATLIQEIFTKVTTLNAFE